MHPVGELLKQTRTAKGISLEQAAMTTRIRINYLAALERGERDALPSPVQGRGFLRLYAGYLGLPPEDLVADWEGRPRPIPVDQPPAAPPPALLQEPAGVAAPDLAEPLPSLAPEGEPDSSADDLPPLPPAAGNSHAILVDVGATLRKQRERLGLSLDDVEKYTHIRRRYLISLEAGRLDQLPSTVQSRGMLSNYAVFLNLDSETLLLRFAEALQSRRIERMPNASTSGQSNGGKEFPRGARPAGTIRRFFTPDLAFGAGLILVLFVFIVWTVSRIGAADPETAAQVTLPSVSDVILASVSPTTAEDNGLPTPMVENQTPGAVQPSLPEATTSLPSDFPTSTLGAINADPLQVYIVAKQRAFLRVTVDGQIRFNGRLIPGNAYPFSGAERIDLLVGNAAAVQVFFNQQELLNQAAAGEPASLTFTQQGVMTPTAMPTATPTVTPLVTATPTVGTPAVSPTITPFIP